MGVGKYRTTALPSYEQAAEDFSGAPYNYTQPSAPPPGVSGNQFDQSAINWNMAQVEGRRRAQSNRDLQQSYNQRYNDWLANAGSPAQRAQPNNPALFEADPYALYNYYNSSVPGLLLQNGRIADPGMGQADPMEQMFALGQPGAPPVARAAAPGYQPQLPPMTPEQIAWASGGRAPAPPASPPVPPPSAPAPGYGPEAGGPYPGNRPQGPTPADAVNAPAPSAAPGYGPEAGGPPPRYAPAAPAPAPPPPEAWLSEARRGYTLPPNEQRQTYRQPSSGRGGPSPYVAPQANPQAGQQPATAREQRPQRIQYPSLPQRGGWGRRY